MSSYLHSDSSWLSLIVCSSFCLTLPSCRRVLPTILEHLKKELWVSIRSGREGSSATQPIASTEPTQLLTELLRILPHLTRCLLFHFPSSSLPQVASHWIAYSVISYPKSSHLVRRPRTVFGLTSWACPSIRQTRHLQFHPPASHD